MNVDDEVDRPASRRWSFLTNHGFVLICIAKDPDLRLRDLSEKVGITERAAQLILSDLISDGYVKRTKVGRRNNYSVNRARPLKHPLLDHHRVGDVLDFLLGD
jgi:hypothetical protein